MGVNWILKAKLSEQFGSQVDAALHMGIRENRLSYIVRNHTVPTKREREALELALGAAEVKRLLKNDHEGILL